MESDVLAKFGGIGVLGTYGLKLLWSWFNKEKQDNSLYKNELDAHEATRKELAEERALRKAAEIELREAREHHEKERSEDRFAREELKDQVFMLRTEVKKLKQLIESRGSDV